MSDNIGIAQIITGAQYTEDNWKQVRPCIPITRDTTVGELFDWIDRYAGSHEITLIKYEEQE